MKKLTLFYLSVFLIGCENNTPIKDQYIDPQIVFSSRRWWNYDIFISDVYGENSTQITKNKWIATSILGIDEKTNTVYYTGTGQDPREMHVFSVNINTLVNKKITSESGTHRAQISPNKKYIIDQFSSYFVATFT